MADPDACGVAGKMMISALRPFFKDTIAEGCLLALFAGTSPTVAEENLRGEYICPPDKVETSSSRGRDEELEKRLVTLSDTLVKGILG